MAVKHLAKENRLSATIVAVCHHSLCQCDVKPVKPVAYQSYCALDWHLYAFSSSYCCFNSICRMNLGAESSQRAATSTPVNRLKKTRLIQCMCACVFLFFVSSVSCLLLNRKLYIKIMAFSFNFALRKQKHNYCVVCAMHGVSVKPLLCAHSRS